MVCSTDRSKAVVPVFIRNEFLCISVLRVASGPRVKLASCKSALKPSPTLPGGFRPFSIAITSLWEERANLSAFRMFDRFVLVWICRFPLPLDVWEWLRFVIVALSGLFSYLLYFTDRSKAVFPVLVLLFVALWFILRGDLFYV